MWFEKAVFISDGRLITLERNNISTWAWQALKSEFHLPVKSLFSNDIQLQKSIATKTITEVSLILVFICLDESWDLCVIASTYEPLTAGGNFLGLRS